MKIEDPKRLTPEVLQKIEEAAMMDCTMAEIALFANVSSSSLYNWLESDPSFRERLDKLRQTPILKARGTITKNLHKEDIAKWYLERKKKVEFAQHSTTDLTSGGKPIIIPGDLHGKHSQTDPSPEPDSPGSP